MKSNINLALDKKKPEKNPVALKIGYYMFAGIFAVALLVLIILFIFRFRYSSLLNQEQATITALNQQSDKKLKMIITNERLAALQAVLGQRGNLDQKVEAIIKLVPNQMTIRSVDADDDKVTLSLATTDLLSLNTYFEQTLPNALRKFAVPIKNVTVNNVDSSNNTYTTSVTFAFTQSQAGN